MTFAGRRVLVVEDDFLVSLVTIDLLEGMGCEVIGPAARVDTALEFVQANSLDAAVLDIDIAGTLIWPVAKELKRRNVPFVFLSAHCRREGMPVSLAAAPQMEKPLEHDELARLLSEMLGARAPGGAAKVSVQTTPFV